MDEQQFVHLLENLLAPDTERVKAATAILKQNYFTSPHALSLLLQILTNHENPQLRQLAAVQARTLVPRHWSSIPAQQKPLIRNQQLQAILNEQTPIVRHSAARVISAIAKIDLDEGEWTDLPRLLLQAAQSSTAAHREVSVYILYTLLESIGDGFMDKLSDLFTLFERTIQDPSADVRLNTMLAFGKIAMILDTDEDPQSLEAYQNAFPRMVAVLKQAIDSGDEDHTTQAFEVFQTILGCEPVLMSKHFKDLVQFMMQIAALKELEDDTRTQALSFLMQCVKYRKLKMQGLKVGEQLTLTSLEIVTELEELAASDDDETTPARTALGLIDLMAGCLPPSQVVVPLLHALGPFVNSPDPSRRRAGILALGMCVEGAPDFIGTQISQVFDMVLRLLDDSDVRVRHAALHSVARLADDLAEELGKRHAQLIPALLKNLDTAMEGARSGDKEKDLDIIKSSCNAIDSVIGGLEKQDVAQYVTDLYRRLSQLFQHPDFKVKAGAAGALGSLAAASEDAFHPYFEQTMRSLAPFVTIKDGEEELDLRGTVCDAMGSIAQAVGPLDFQPYVRPLMQASGEALHLGHPRLKETSYILWSTLAKVYGAEFTPFLPEVVQGLFESLLQDESDLEVELGEEAKDLLGTEITIAGKKIKVSAAEDGSGMATLSKVAGSSNDEDDDDELLDEDDSDMEDWEELTATTAVAMEKEIAIEVVGDIMTHVKGAYLSYFEKTVDLLLGLVKHSYEGVRKGAVSSLWRAYACLWDICDDQMEKWKPGLPLQVQPKPELMKLSSAIMTATLELWIDENDRSAVTDINRTISATLKHCGPAMLAESDVVQRVTEVITTIITKIHPCQLEFGEQDEMDDFEETSEYDWLVIDTALDVLIGLAAALGPTFGELWKIFEKPVMRYASSQEPQERSTAAGVIGECISHMGEAVTPYTTSLLKLLLHRLSDEDPEMSSNASFAIGMLIEKTTNNQEIVRSYNTILSKLEPLLRKTDARLLDNSAGCVSRMIMKNKERVPLNEVLPVLAEILPLREDFEENVPIYKMILWLYQTRDATIANCTRDYMSVFAQVLGPPQEQLTDEIRAQLVELIKYLNKLDSELIQPYEMLKTIVNS
ncbi:MAG: hypothetical protein M1812_006494 [Candelaria pacifica]|nr:MAG: hypothetical protein M1812_006494 [Candelaria pacifica]